MSDDDFQHDIPNIPDADKAYSPAFHDRMRRLSDRVAQTRAGVQKAFDPNQPRAPKGSPTGGQWVDVDTGSTGKPLGELLDEKTKQGVMDAVKKVVVFHGTTQEALESILEKGLIPDSGTRGADAWMSVADPEMYAMMMLDQSSKFPDRKASVFVTGSPQVAEGYARFAMDVNQGSDGVVFKIEVPVNAGGFREDEFSQGGNKGLLSLRRVGGIPREWIKQYKVVGEPQFSIVDGVYGVEKANRTLYAVVICKSDLKKREEGFFDELLESDDEAVERVIDKTKKRMKARGLSQEALDLAYGKPKK